MSDDLTGKEVRPGSLDSSSVLDFFHIGVGFYEERVSNIYFEDLSKYDQLKKCPHVILQKSNGLGSFKCKPYRVGKLEDFVGSSFSVLTDSEQEKITDELNQETLLVISNIYMFRGSLQNHELTDRIGSKLYVKKITKNNKLLSKEEIRSNDDTYIFHFDFLNYGPHKKIREGGWNSESSSCDGVYKGLTHRVISCDPKIQTIEYLAQGIEGINISEFLETEKVPYTKFVPFPIP